MGYNFNKRISKLRSHISEQRQGRIGLYSATVVSIIVCCAILLLFTSPPPDPEQFIAPRQVTPPPVDNSVDSDTARILARIRGSKPDAQLVTQVQTEPTEDFWRQQVIVRTQERVDWLDGLPFGAADRYFEFAKWVVSVVPSPSTEEDPEAAMWSGFVAEFNLGEWYIGFCRAMAGASLRIGFVLIGFWQFWLASFAIGYLGCRIMQRHKPTADLLGVCDRLIGPFYSGIYAPLKPNDGDSGTDYSCPSLACPAQVGPAVASGHPLGSMLKKFKADNETTLGLLRVILAYPDYPAEVEDERKTEFADDVHDLSDDDSGAAKHIGIVSNKAGTIEGSTRVGLEAVLQAHRALILYFNTGDNSRGVNTPKGFERFVGDIHALQSGVGPTAGVLLSALTPQRALAIAQLPTSAVATAYLAIEAGKSLVYRRVGSGFAQISRYPHLQARAVMQSLPSYHNDFSGDDRLQIRQAVLGARRHGDFGRAQLPVRMSVASRALRDWLELLYGESSERQEIAWLVELEGHIHELHDLWRNNFSKFVRAENAKTKEDDALNRGVPFKSVVLVPLRSVVNVAFQQVSGRRQERVAELLELTRERRARLSISAALPGYQREARELGSGSSMRTGVTKELGNKAKTKKLVQRWFIARRMLVRYNWLSTRVGDDTVPDDGLVQAIVLQRDESEHATAHGMDALVPIRIRRFDELFHEGWERDLYPEASHPNDVEVIVKPEDYDVKLEKKTKAAEQGDFDIKKEEAQAASANG